MPTYPTYKLGEICVIERGGSPRPIKDYLTKDDNGLNWIKIGDATLSNKYIYTTAEKIKPEGLSKTRMVESGDLILSNSMSFGRPYIMRTSGCIHDGWVVFRLNKDIIDEEYLYNILNSNEVYAQFNHLATGSTVKNLNIDRVKEVVIPLPPLPTQHAIVSRIEALFAELDKAVQHLRTAQQQLKTYRQVVLNHWLNNDEGKWETVKLGEVLQKIEAGKSFRCNEKVPALHEKGIVKISAVTWGEFLEDECKTIINEDLYNPQFAIHKGDLLISRANTIQLVGNCVLVRKEPKRNIMLSDKVLRLVISDNADSDFILYSLRTSKSRTQIQNMSTGNQDSMRNIGQDRIKKIEIPLPPLADQHRIVQEIESRLSQAEAAEASIAEALHKTEALRQSILKKAFSGELM